MEELKRILQYLQDNENTNTEHFPLLDSQVESTVYTSADISFQQGFDALQPVESHTYFSGDAASLTVHTTGQATESNQIPGGLLLVGAALTEANGESYTSLHLRGDAVHYALQAAEQWEIEDITSAIAALEWLRSAQQTAQVENLYQQLRQGDYASLEPECIEAYENSMADLVESLGFDAAVTEDCGSVLAWSIERTGYLVRILYHIGFLNLHEAVQWLSDAAVLANSQFESCEQYIASMLYGCAICGGNAGRLCKAARRLYCDGLYSFPLPAE